MFAGRPIPLILIAAAVVTFAGTIGLLPPIHQWQSYHAFADQREVIGGVPNSWNTLSNIPFVVAGLAGIAMAARGCFLSRRERNSALAFFAGTLLTGIGSSVYHWSPNDATLVYDRLGMVIAFAAFFVMFVQSRLEAGSWLLAGAVATGTASVAWWRISGDLRFYGWVQFFPIAALIVLPVLTRPRYSSERAAMTAVFLSYGMAKWLEHVDHGVFEATGGIISGHTLKHLFSAMAPVIVLWWIETRSAIPSVEVNATR